MGLEAWTFYGENSWGFGNSTKSSLAQQEKPEV